MREPRTLLRLACNFNGSEGLGGNARVDVEGTSNGFVAQLALHITLFDSVGLMLVVWSWHTDNVRIFIMSLSVMLVVGF